jgi:type I restriction enzyme M protein
MATRPVFVVTLDDRYFIRENIEFEFFSGFSDKQKKKCINSLHHSYLEKNGNKKILEISSKSENELGVKLSAFNLMINTVNNKSFSVESAFQSSKVFEKGGPYKDLLEVSSREAKKDERLKNSGKIVSFYIDGKIFSTEPKTYFYNWLYINTLHLYDSLTIQLLEYDAFTDIAFNPEKSINCQAEAAAIYVSLQKQGLLQKALKDKDAFLEIVYPSKKDAISDKNVQLSFFDN